MRLYQIIHERKLADLVATKLSGPERKAGGNALLETGATAGSKPGASDSMIPRLESKPLLLEEF